MTWTQNIAQWRSLPAERKLQIRREAIPLDVAQSMAFEREPVAIELIRETLSAHARKMPRGLSKPGSAR
jgi:hypothetical protein